ncbi:MAG: quinone oxidoreductase [Sphingomonadales bacterium]|nr:quinone oxidoreductase [Sphingomonadales bacterium]
MTIACKAMVVAEHGPPSRMAWTDVELPSPAPHEIAIEQRAVGVNMIDTYVISGAYTIDPLPLTPGVEGAGVVTAVGRDVEGFAPGDRVAYGGPPLGAYAQIRTMPPAYVVRIPDWLSFDATAASMIAGLTAQMMVKRVYPVGPGVAVLVHAAAGSSGSALARWASDLGARVIGTVGGAAKVAAAEAAGCQHVIDYATEEFAYAVKALTDGKGVDVVYDGIGRDTFTGSFQALTPTGMFVSYGQASGPCPPIDLGDLPVTFSNFIARPSVFAFNATRPAFEDSMADVFDALERGVLEREPAHRYPLEDAARALTDLMARKTSGSIVLTV